ncbi:2092_t:CDS:1, partial [Funneliformis geosporum]
QIILKLQINPPGNMATLPKVFNSMAPLLAQIPQYIGQELPDEFYNHVMQVINYGNSLGVVGFDNAIKTNVLAGKMAGRFTPPNPFNNSAGNLINTLALFIAWLRETYRAVKLSSAQANTSQE